MFTGIIEELGSVIAIDKLDGKAARLRINGKVVAADSSHGDSIAVNGVCLTVVEVDGDEFTADVMAPTLEFTTTGSLEPGAQVNLERAVRANDRFGGHVVSGHVDAVGQVLSRKASDHWETVQISVPGRLLRQLAIKGSVALDGVSLTTFGVSSADVRDGSDGWLEVSLIPTTIAETTLGARGVGDFVNIETDVLAKYVDRLLERRPE